LVVVGRPAGRRDGRREGGLTSIVFSLYIVTFLRKKIKGDLAQWLSAFALHAKGHEFESYNLQYFYFSEVKKMA
jgi:hypothetical protein